jgi:hypothetical protein
MEIPFVRVFATLCSGLWIVALVVNFTVVVKNEVSLLHEKQLEDRWLLHQCEDPVFAARLQNYNDPCAHARHRMQMNIHIIAFHRALDQVFLCGSYSCEALVWLLLEKVRSNLIIFFFVFILVLILVPTMVLPFWRRWTDHVAETHIRTKFNMPYGYNSALVHGTHDYGSNYAPQQYGQQPYAPHTSQNFQHPRAYPQQRLILNTGSDSMKV